MAPELGIRRDRLNWSLYAMPFSLEEVFSVLGASAAELKIDLNETSRLSSLTHPCDHMERFHFLNIRDIVLLVYKGPICLDSAFDTIDDICSEGCQDFIQFIEGVSDESFDEFVSGYRSISDTEASALEIWCFLRVAYVVARLFHEYTKGVCNGGC